LLIQPEKVRVPERNELERSLLPSQLSSSKTQRVESGLDTSDLPENKDKRRSTKSSLELWNNNSETEYDCSIEHIKTLGLVS
jgi:hypothetical protein